MQAKPDRIIAPKTSAPSPSVTARRAVRLATSWSSLVAASALIAGCALGTPQVGTTAADVTMRYGQPTRVVPLAGGGQRLQYSRLPAGQSAMMVDVDASGKVARAYEALTLAMFSTIEAGKWTRADVEAQFGPPARIERVGNWPSDIMTYRWREDAVDKFYFVYLDRNQVVQKTQQGVELIEVIGRER